MQVLKQVQMQALKQVQKQVEVRPSEYRSVRWEFATLKAGTTGRCAVRAVVR